MKEPELKKKGLLSFKGQYIYSGLIVFILLFGLTYSLIFFIQNQKGVAGGLTTDLISVETVDDGNVSLTNLFPVSDEVGLNGISKTLTITNTSNTSINVKLGLTPNEDSTIPASSMKYGVYLNNVLDNQIYYDGYTFICNLKEMGKTIIVSSHSRSRDDPHR